MLISSILPGTAARWLQVIDLFPWTSSSSVSHSSISPSQLFLGLTDHYDPETHVESIIVKSVWYGKRQVGALHEFLLIQIEDTATQIQNYLVLDRNNTESANLGNGGMLAGLGLGFRAFKGVTLDAFRISRDGMEDQLMIDCKLKPRIYLQTLKLAPEQPLFLYQLATLALVVSREYPTYSADLRNCYFFAGLVWAGVRRLCPKAVVTNRHGEQQGRFGPLVYILADGEINRIYKAFEAQMDIVNSNLTKGRHDWLRLKSETSIRARKGPSEPWPEALLPRKSRPSRMASIEELPEADNEDSEMVDGSALVPISSSEPRLSTFRRSRERLCSLIGLRNKDG